MGDLRIALAQINPTVGALDANVAKIGETLDAARAAGADLVTFPELALSGYPPEDLLLRPRFLADCRKALDQAARLTGGIAALVGFPDAAKGKVYNAAALLSDGEILGTYRKIELPNYEVFDEKRYFTPGRGCLVFECNQLRVFATICEDVWVEGGAPERYAVRNGAGVILNISASPFHAGKLDIRRDVLARFARRTGAYVAYTNLVGGQDELVFDGGSVVLSPSGEPIASAQRFEEDLLLADLRLDQLAAKPTPRQANGRWEKRIVIRSANSSGLEPVVPAFAQRLSPLREIHKALVLGTRDYMHKNGFAKAVIGLSGGIDSALTAVLAVEALGKDNVVGVTMPSHYTSSETLSDAEQLAANLGIRLLTIPIKPIFDAYLNTLEKDSRCLFPEVQADKGLPEKTPDVFSGITAENIQARVRGNLLMALSNWFGWLVLTTGNKSEIAVGYCTLYGDMAGGFAVIKDVPKTRVYELAERINTRAGRDIIPRDTLTRPPTAELRPDQKDEDSLPPYAELDPVLRAYVEQDMAPDEIAATGPDIERVLEIIRLVDGAEYKRRQAPPGIKITPKAFGRDRRLPITNRYGGGLGGEGEKEEQDGPPEGGTTNPA